MEPASMDDDAAASVLRGAIVRDQDSVVGRAGVQIEQQLADARTGAVSRFSVGLIGEQHRGRAHRGPRSATRCCRRQRAAAVVAQRVLKPTRASISVAALLASRLRQLQRQHDVRDRSQRRHQWKDWNTKPTRCARKRARASSSSTERLVREQLPRRSAGRARQQGEQRRFARSGRTDDGDRFARGHRQRNP